MISRKSLREIKLLQQAGQIVAQALKFLEPLIAPGITTKFLDEQAHKFIKDHGAVSAFKGYKGFPAYICASVNEEVVHGVPSTRKLVNGEIISIDIGVQYQGYIGDAARTFPVGTVSQASANLLKVCEECLALGIKQARTGNHLSDISRAIQIHAEKNGYSVVRDYTGHGIGTQMHEEPQIPNYVDNSWNVMDIPLQVGYCLAIEPMVNAGKYRVKTVRRQGWDVVVTSDKQWSAHFENSIVILDKGPIILTQENIVPLE